MIPYWIMFFIPAMAAIESAPIHGSYLLRSRGVRLNSNLKLMLFVFTILIGFRYEVGGDWRTYFNYLYFAENLTLTDLKTVADPGYIALNMISLKLGMGVTGVNLMSAIIFTFGLGVFLRSLPRPWLALSCAVPYLIIVVSMGYTRQAVALSLAMVGLAALQKQKFSSFVFWVVLGALFHKSAVLLIPIAVLTSSRQRIQAIGLAGIAGFASYDALLAQHADRLVDIYIDQQLTQSQGALIRLSMNALPAALLLVFRKRFLLPNQEFRLWFVMSIIALVMMVALFATGLSTALDRLALYIIPLQLVVFSYLPDALGLPNKKNVNIVAGILLYYAAVLFIWLNFAAHAPYWVPYQIGLSLS